VKNRKVEAVEERSSVLKGLAQWFSPLQGSDINSTPFLW
jgi:hypothetical protein